DHDQIGEGVGMEVTAVPGVETVLDDVADLATPGAFDHCRHRGIGTLGNWWHVGRLVTLEPHPRQHAIVERELRAPAAVARRPDGKVVPRTHQTPFLDPATGREPGTHVRADVRPYHRSVPAPPHDGGTAWQLD